MTSFANGEQITVSHSEPWAAKMRQCTQVRLRHSISQLVALGNYSRDTLKTLREETRIQYDQQTRGILHFYTRPNAWRTAQHSKQLMRDSGHGPLG